uniref:MotA/TolQ/ExbB proton channel family protein n=1 Tax=Roseihalotalea indica TaxID=2867963 RepID=A0AA49JGB8_9BACT|nr:MotA/TolQ/ExbB proton channel family protein [Tunicatimonas sp. TK19036]
MNQRLNFFTKVSRVFFLVIFLSSSAKGQESTAVPNSASVQDSLTTVNAANAKVPKEVPPEEETNANQDLHQIIRQQFVNGDWRFMSPVLLCLIIGLIISIERIIHLNLATSNVDHTLKKLRADLQEGGVEQALGTLNSRRNPVATIFQQSLTKWDDGMEMVEKAILSYGSVEMGKLERGLVWISLFISIAPMLGFMGTVIGMINAFDAIEAAGDISPTLVASGIKTALLTTVAGLIVAIILQLFYNYCVAKIDRLVNDMERASIAFVDVLVDYRTTSAAL